jgi:hypothetical protein
MLYIPCLFLQSRYPTNAVCNTTHITYVDSYVCVFLQFYVFYKERFDCVYEHEQNLYWEVGLYIFVVRTP